MVKLILQIELLCLLHTPVVFASLCVSFSWLLVFRFSRQLDRQSVDGKLDQIFTSSVSKANVRNFLMIGSKVHILEIPIEHFFFTWYEILLVYLRVWDFLIGWWLVIQKVWDFMKVISGSATTDIKIGNIFIIFTYSKKFLQYFVITRSCLITYWLILSMLLKWTG